MLSITKINMNKNIVICLIICIPENFEFKIISQVALYGMVLSCWEACADMNIYGKGRFPV